MEVKYTQLTAEQARESSKLFAEKRGKEEREKPITEILEKIKTTCSYGWFRADFKHSDINRYQAEKLIALGYTVVDELELMTDITRYYWTKNPGIIVSWEPK